MLYLSDLQINYSKYVLIVHYTHLGFKKTYLHHSFRKAMLGVYNQLCIINPIIILSNLKFVSRFIISMHLNYFRFAFVSYDFPVSHVHFLKFQDNYILLNYWPSGFFTNSISVRTTERIKKKFNSCPPHFPDYLIFLNVEPGKSFSIIKEARKFFVPSIGFCDSTEDLSVFHYWIPINTKSGISKEFIIRYLNNTLVLAAQVKRTKFKKFVSDSLRFFQWARWNHLTSYKKFKDKYKWDPEFVTIYGPIEEEDENADTDLSFY